MKRYSVAAFSLLTTVAALLSAAQAHAREAFTDERVYRLLAHNLLNDQFYGYARGHNLAYRAPGYPFFDAFVRLFHDTTTSVLVVQAVLAGATVWLSALIARRLFGDAAAVLTAALLLVTGTIAAYASFELSESLSTFTLVAAVALVTVAWDRASPLLAAGSGVVLGASILARPQTLLLVAPLAVVVGLVHGVHDRRRLAMGGALIAGALLTLAPWTVRNAVRLHAFVPVSTYGGVNFFLANNEKADGVFRPVDTVVGREEYERIARLSEVEQDREFYRRGFRFIGDHPGSAIHNWLRDGVLFLRRGDLLVSRHYRAGRARLPRVDDRFLMPFAAIGGLVAFRSRDRWRCLVPAIVVGYFIAFFMVFIPLARFRHGIVPFLAAYAGAGIAYIVAFVRNAFGPARRR